MNDTIENLKKLYYNAFFGESGISLTKLYKTDPTELAISEKMLKNEKTIVLTSLNYYLFFHVMLKVLKIIALIKLKNHKKNGIDLNIVNKIDYLFIYILYLKMDKFNTTQIGLAKFNNKTLKENRNWKTKKNWTGASYGFQHYIPEKIPYNSYLYIIEMNNETNKIAGVGFIRNQRRSEWRSKIYNDCEDYNRFIIKK